MLRRLERKGADRDSSVDSIELIDEQLTAAKVSIYRLKRFDRSAKEQLEQHRHWLEQYVATETRDRKRHERRLKQLEIRRQRRLMRQRVLQRCKQGALATLLFLRSTGLAILNGVVSVLIYCFELLLSSATWIVAKVYSFARLVIRFAFVSFSWGKPKAYALALWLAKLIRIGLSWSLLKARAFALWLAKAVSISFAWIRREAYALTRSAANLVSLGLSWGGVKARAFALWLAKAVSISFAWIRREAYALTRSAANLISIGLAWSGVKARAFALWLVNAASISFAWIRREASVLARSAAKLISIGLSWSGVKARAFALWLVNAASISLAWIRREASALARSAAKLMSIGLAWSSEKAHTSALALLNLASIGSFWIAETHELVSYLSKLLPVTRRQARRYRRRGLGLAGRLTQRAWVGVQRLQHSTEPIGLSGYGPSADKEESGSKPNEGTGPKLQHAPLQRQDTTEDHIAAAVSGEEQTANLIGGLSSAGQDATEDVAPTATEFSPSKIDVQTGNNQLQAKARSRRRRRRRKRKRRDSTILPAHLENPALRLEVVSESSIDESPPQARSQQPLSAR
jgi:hypothetical protein